jgi:hypothetical protein
LLVVAVEEELKKLLLAVAVEQVRSFIRHLLHYLMDHIL